MRSISIASSAFSSDIFQPVKISGREFINELYQYQIIIKTPDLDNVDFYKKYEKKSPAASVDLTAWLKQSVTVVIELDGLCCINKIKNTEAPSPFP